VFVFKVFRIKWHSCDTLWGLKCVVCLVIEILYKQNVKQNVGSPLADKIKRFILEILFEQIKYESDWCIFCYSTQFRVTFTQSLKQELSNEAAELKKQVTLYVSLSQTSKQYKH